MNKKISNAKQAWKMNQVILAMNNEGAYYGSGWLYVWPDGSDYSECLEYFGDDESFKELSSLYYKVFKNHYKDGLYNPIKVGPDALDFANETLKKLKISGEFKETQPKLWVVSNEESVKETVTEAVNKEPKHLRELISKLNKPVEFEDEVFEPIFNFVLEQRDGQWFLYDSNGQYTINYEEDQMYFYQQMADEFGAKIPEIGDDIHPQLEQAIQADFGSDAYFEWEDSVTMVVISEMKESKHNHTMKENKLIEAQEKIELTTEIIKALYDSDVDFQEAEDEDGKVFLIVYGWDTIKQMQQIIKPDFVPEDKYDTSVIDNLKDVEWGFSDEWSRCDECGKVIRTQPDSYSFVPDYWINDAELLCGDCVRDNHAEEYAQSLINKERLANTILTDDNLEELGFIRVESDFESGWYDRNDSPKEILQTALDKHPNGEFLFSISGQAQFATQFELWAREESLEEEVENELKEIKHKTITDEKLEKEVDYDSSEIMVYQFPSSIENFLPEFERLCDEFELTFLGKGLGMEQKEGDDPNFFVEGPLKDLEALADELEYQLHPDYLSSADEFAYEDILIESKKVYIKEATRKQIDAKRKELYAKEKSGMTDSDKIEYVENSARSMMVSILVYGAKPGDSDESFNKLFEREIKNRYLGNFLKADNFGNPAISRERIKELWDEMIVDFKKAEVGYAGEDNEGVSYNYVRFADESLTKKTIKESVDKKFSEEEANKFVKELIQKFFDEGEYFDIWSSAGVIEAQIEWGDWKHQHLFFKRTVQKFFNDLNIDIDIDSQVTEEDESDIYSASYKITKI